MNYDQKTTRVNMEVVSTKNPIQFELSQFGNNIVSVQVDSFYYNQGNTSTNFLGLVLQGCRNNVNEVGVITNCLKTFPARNGIFDFQSGDENFEGFIFNGGSTIELGFISRDTGSINGTSLATPIVFNTNYLLNISFEVCYE